MPLPELAILLFGIGVALLLGELLLPAHGIIGVIGGLAIAAGVIICYLISFALGTAVLVGMAVLAPFVGAATVRLWPKTPIGRRVVLPPVFDPLLQPTVRIGQSGVAVSELRPMGTCEFDGSRLEAISEYGMIKPGAPVTVVALTNNRPIVRGTSSTT